MGAAVEAKGFVVTDGALRSPFYERVLLDAWPGDGVSEAVDAWASSREGEPLRLRWQDDGATLEASVRSRSASLELVLDRLMPAGEGVGPHGPLSWRSGRATLRLDGRAVSGVGVVERLRGDVATPSFGRFEMWLLRTADGSLVLGRSMLDADALGTALRVDRLAQAGVGPFAVEVTTHRRHEPSGFDLPVSWRLPADGGVVVSRVRPGDPAVGRSASGGVAVYDVGLAASQDGRSTALVFHLQDAAVRDSDPSAEAAPEPPVR